MRNSLSSLSHPWFITQFPQILLASPMLFIVVIVRSTGKLTSGNNVSAHTDTHTRENFGNFIMFSVYTELWLRQNSSKKLALPGGNEVRAWGENMGNMTRACKGLE